MLVLLSASVERFSVSHVRDFFLHHPQNRMYFFLNLHMFGNIISFSFHLYNFFELILLNVYKQKVGYLEETISTKWN